jgi:glutamyl-tRNA synthetase
LENGGAFVSKEEGGREEVIRFKNPNKKVIFKDIVRGDIQLDTTDLGDFVIAKDEKTPLYHFAVVVDDHEMKISHVIRGEDHIPNTPRQILLQEALGFSRPHYAHLPLLLGKDRSKLSKREGGEALSDYMKGGYPPEAMFNFLALLGWHPQDDREILSAHELIEQFSLERVQKGGAVFDKEKLDWISHQYILNMSDEDLMERAKPFLPEKWAEGDNISRVIKLFKDRIVKFADLADESKFLFEPPEYESDLLIWKKSTPEEARKHLEAVCEIISNDGDIMSYAESQGKGNVLWPLRVALSGQKNSPGPLEILECLGKAESLDRINRAIAKLS